MNEEVMMENNSSLLNEPAVSSDLHEIHDKKKLLIATDSFLPRADGVTRFLSEIIPRLVSHYDITVLCPNMGTYEDPRIRIVTIPLSKLLKGGEFPLARLKRSTIRREVKLADIVFAQSIGPIGGYAILAARKKKKKVAAYIHSIEWELWPRVISNIFLKKYVRMFAKHYTKKIYNKCDLLLMPAQNVAELFLWNNIRAPSQVVHLGVDTDKFHPASPAARAQIREKLTLEDDDVVIGYHGRISREKDLITLLRAFTRLQQDNLKMLIVGDGVPSIKKQFSRRGIIMVGVKNDPIPYLQAMDIYVLPSLTETTSLGTLEAMSCGLAVVATEVGFLRSYIKSGENGFFFEKQNPYHLAKQLQILIHHPELRQRIGEKARATAIQKFSWDKTAEGIIKALQELEKK